MYIVILKILIIHMPYTINISYHTATLLRISDIPVPPNTTLQSSTMTCITQDQKAKTTSLIFPPHPLPNNDTSQIVYTPKYTIPSTSPRHAISPIITPRHHQPTYTIRNMEHKPKNIVKCEYQHIHPQNISPTLLSQTTYLSLTF